MFVFEVFEQK